MGHSAFWSMESIQVYVPLLQGGRLLMRTRFLRLSFLFPPKYIYFPSPWVAWGALLTASWELAALSFTCPGLCLSSS